MPALPDGEAVPADGPLPWLGGAGAGRTFGVYIHVPFCRVRCGYCDFNTYTAAHLGGGASPARYAEIACREIDRAARELTAAGVADRLVSTVFFGGGTPTVLPVADLARMLDAVRQAWGLTPDAEITTEANPDSVTPESLGTLATAGFTRVSFGMQSAVPHVLATLDRTHDPRRIPDVVSWARHAGLDVSLDLIYGTPGETLADWQASLDAAVSAGVGHVSAYALVVEPRTRMGASVRRGELPAPDEDDQATKYEMADQVLGAAGLRWYEVSNWARTDAERCQHNLAYWRGQDWWGIGPGAHSHVAIDGPAMSSAGELGRYAGQGSEFAGTGGTGLAIPSRDPGVAGHRGDPPAGCTGVRWWNVKHPRAYAALIDAGRSPAAGRELLTRADADLESVMLGMRLAEGLGLGELSVAGRRTVAGLVADGLLDGRAAVGGRAVLTLRGRLLADAVVRQLAP